MKKKTVATRIISFVLAVTLLAETGIGVSAWAAEADTASADPVEQTADAEKTAASSTSEAGASKKSAAYTKNENVYAKLSQDGTVQEAYVVNAFSVSEHDAITDYGVYSDVKNLTDLSEIDVTKDTITFETDKENFYYEGDIADAQLPWNIRVNYTLDGRKVDADKLAGAAGDLGIHILTEQNKAVNSVFYDNYLLQISVVLEAEKCKNIRASGASIADAGSSKNIVFTVMPKKSGDMTLSAEITDFEMSGIQIAAVPFSTSIEIPDTDDMLDDMTTLTDAIAELNDGVGDLKTGTNELNDGLGDLTGGSSDYAQGLSTLNNNSGQLTSGSASIKSALDTIATSLASADGEGGADLGELAQLPAGLRSMATGLGQMAAGLTQLRDGYATMFTTLDGAMKIPAVSEADIGSLGAAVAAMSDSPEKAAAAQAFDNMVASYTAAQTAQGTYDHIREGMSGISGGLTAIVDGDGTAANPGLNGIISALNTLADTLETALSGSDMMEQIKQLTQGLTTLSNEYGTFHDGLITYTDGVTQLMTGYNELHNGLVELNNGTGDLAEGVRELHEGTTELEDETADLPDTIQVEIDKLMEDYDVGEYAPVSYISPQNVNIDTVQFVMVTEAIKMPDAPDVAESEPAPQNFWDRLVALFRKE
jgi:X-X-X-Leu-X-X-Gly heptad repeat protein